MSTSIICVGNDGLPAAGGSYRHEHSDQLQAAVQGFAHTAPPLLAARQNSTATPSTVQISGQCMTATTAKVQCQRKHAPGQPHHAGDLHCHWQPNDHCRRAHQHHLRDRKRKAREISERRAQQEGQHTWVAG